MDHGPARKSAKGRHHIRRIPSLHNETTLENCYPGTPDTCPHMWRRPHSLFPAPAKWADFKMDSLLVGIEKTEIFVLCVVKGVVPGLLLCNIPLTRRKITTRDSYSTVSNVGHESFLSLKDYYFNYVQM